MRDTVETEDGRTTTIRRIFRIKILIADGKKFLVIGRFFGKIHKASGLIWTNITMPFYNGFKPIFERGDETVKFGYWFFAALLVIVSVSVAAPEPAIVPSQRYWTVNVKYEHPQQIELQARGQSEPLRFWYVIISLTNKTKNEVHFYPKCELMTNTLQVIPAGKDTPEAVFLTIKKRYRTKYRFLEPLERTDNRILQGADNAKDIAIIWPDFDPKAKSIKIFISGLSNETAVVDHPVEKDKEGKPIKVFLRKTLELSYEIQGDPVFRSDAKLVYEGQRWIMR